jgi:hypothetical protein
LIVLTTDRGGITGYEAQHAVGAAFLREVGWEFPAALGTGGHDINHNRSIQPRHLLHRKKGASVTKKIRKS